MAPEDIIRNDFQKNHVGREYDESYVHEVFQKYLDIGGSLFATLNVLIFFKAIDGGIEFHCMNGGSGKDLTESINAFLTSVSQVCGKAATYYDNPRINELSHYSKYPVSVEKIDDGIDRTYKMSFILGN